MKRKPADPRHEAAYQGMIAALREQDLSPQEMLAVAANLVGKIIAMQDQRSMTPEQALHIVTLNIAEGNGQVLAKLRDAPAEGRA